VRSNASSPAWVSGPPGEDKWPTCRCNLLADSLAVLLVMDILLAMAAVAVARVVALDLLILCSGIFPPSQEQAHPVRASRGAQICVPRLRQNFWISRWSGAPLARTPTVRVSDVLARLPDSLGATGM